jgi:hypothetical protein
MLKPTPIPPPSTVIPKELETHSDVMDAYKLGTSAFKQGLMAIPAQDVELMPLIKKNNGQTKVVLAILNAWSKGWHTANLQEPYDFTAEGEAIEEHPVPSAGIRRS